MGLVLYIQQGESCPMFICDACGEIIEQCNEGVAVYPEHGLDNGSSFAPKFAHRGGCHTRIESDGSGDGGWQPLEYFMYWLAHNCKYRPLKQAPYTLEP